jgi:hypothetical protein
MTLANYSFVFNGFTIGNGTSYTVTGVDGLGGTSPLRIQDDNRGYLDGSWSGRDFYDERTVYIDVTVLGDSTHTAQANYKTLQQNFAPQPLGYYPDPTGLSDTANQLKLFQYRLNGNTGDMQMYGRSRGLQTPINADFTYGYIQTRIMLSFPDPRYYTDAGTTHTGTSFDVTNAGWAISCPTIFISSVTATSGEITDGTIGSTTDGKTHMYFANMTAGAALDIDLLSRVVYMDYAPTRNVLTAASTGWLQMNPLSTATWRSNIGSMTTVTRDAYI